VLELREVMPYLNDKPEPTNDAGATAPPEVGGDGVAMGLVAKRRMVRSTPAFATPKPTYCHPPFYVTRRVENT